MSFNPNEIKVGYYVHVEKERDGANGIVTGINGDILTIATTSTTVYDNYNGSYGARYIPSKEVKFSRFDAVAYHHNGTNV